MSKRKKQYWDGKSRHEKEVQALQREIDNANRGIVDDTKEQIRKEIKKEIPDSAPSTYVEGKTRLFVLDTNAILSCVDILYDKDDEFWREPLDYKPNLNHAHLIIPEIVFNELDHINKTDHSINGMIARKAIGRLTKYFMNSGRNIGDIMMLKAPVPTGYFTQTISILPLNKDFWHQLPLLPKPEDNDGWIALTALEATLLYENYTDWSAVDFAGRNSSNSDVCLLTNDKHLITKADNYGVHTKRYSFKKRPAFSGCREIMVPPEMFELFFHEEKLSQKDFLRFMPNEEPLVANEYVIMHPEEDEYPRSYFSVGIPFVNIARYNKNNDTLWPLRAMKYEGETPPNAGIATYYDALNDDNIKRIVVTGKAGTGKTYTPIVHAIKAVKRGKYRRIVVIPSQSAKNPLGALPGKEADKMEPMVAFVKDAIENYLESTPEFKKKRDELRQFGDRDIESHNKTYDQDEPRKRKKDSTNDFYLSKADEQRMKDESKMTYNDFLKSRVKYIYDRYFIALPYEAAQGRTFNDSIIILDEFQRTSVDDASTLLTRSGENSKLIVSGDVNQIHDSTPEKRLRNGLTKAAISFFDKDSSAFIYLSENLRSETADIVAGEVDKEALLRLGLWY